MDNLTIMKNSDSRLYRDITHRTEMVLGPDMMKKISETRVIVFGAGGVGSWCCESLVRSGIGHLTVVDSDIVCATNINRQIQATSLNIGESKVEEIGKRLTSINPEAEIKVIHSIYDENTSDSFNLSSYDYVIDAIDSIKHKVHLLEKCVESGITVFSSMGAAAKTDPSKIKTGKLSSTTVCPLARIVRKRLKERGVKTDFLCVYSLEQALEPAVESICKSGECGCSCLRDEFSRENNIKSADWCSMKKRINGALVHITAVFGFYLSWLVINDISAKS